ncbi:hypothetical protein BpHYR1_030485 [Brachionus plicatilis]|uniref:Uncharacterized protein n=1 Tax=Brachionus plicatilis TaxID=10195 RepID=A0A3M7PD51_BRAPC|nr:hypothetical protein BpHYR1_030485 [Brachionus plicatilis]
MVHKRKDYLDGFLIGLVLSTLYLLNESSQLTVAHQKLVFLFLLSLFMSKNLNKWGLKKLCFMLQQKDHQSIHIIYFKFILQSINSYIVFFITIRKY